MYITTYISPVSVIPLHKKGDLSDINNYRPISLLPIFSKILEVALFLQIVDFIELHNFITGQQYGFRRGRSTVEAIIAFTEAIYDTFEENKYSIATFMDLTKAFDCVSHGIILRKLYCYNFHPSSCRMMNSYLVHRHQQVSCKNNTSEEVKINSVPQGSILGPPLFIIYINDLSGQNHGEKTVLFADDTTLQSSSVCKTAAFDKNNLAVKRATEWFTVNGLTVNPDKSAGVTFSMKKDIEESSVKFLGI